MSNLYQQNLFMSVNAAPHTVAPPIIVDVNLPLSMYYSPAHHSDIFSSGECSSWLSGLFIIDEDRGITSPYDDDGG